MSVLNGKYECWIGLLTQHPFSKNPLYNDIRVKIHLKNFVTKYIFQTSLTTAWKLEIRRLKGTKQSLSDGILNRQIFLTDEFIYLINKFLLVRNVYNKPKLVLTKEKSSFSLKRG